MARKFYLIQAMSDAGAMLLDVRVDTRKAQALAEREALAACDASGGGHMRSKDENAKGWGVYRVEAGAARAPRLFPAEAAPVIERFDAWLASGGAA